MKKAWLFLFFFLFSALLFSQQITSLEDIITLKKLGFSDQEILQTLKSQKVVLKLTAKDFERLKKEGFGPEILEWLKRFLQQKLTVSQILRWVEKGLSAEEILEKMEGKTLPSLSPKEALLLVKKGAHPALLFALKRKKLGKQDILLLAAKKTSVELYLKLFSFAPPAFRPSGKEALELLKKGVPREVIKALIQRKFPSSSLPSSSSPWQSYLHVGREFRLFYPAHWQIIRKVEEGVISYYATPEKAKNPEELSVFFAFARLHLYQDSPFYNMTLDNIGEKFVRLILVEHPQMKVVGKTLCQFGSKKGKQWLLEGFSSKKQKNMWGFLALLRQRDTIYTFAALCPLAEKGKYQKVFEEALQRIELGYPGWAKRRRNYFQPHQLVEKYKGAVVCVIAGDETGWKGAGSGFIVRSDGIVVTNHHVVWNNEKKQPYSRFLIVWDSSVGRSPVSAKLIGATRKEAANFLLSLTLGGKDIAVLKITEGGPFPTVKLTPLSEVRLGDPVVAMGFPRLDLFGQGSFDNLSLFVTRGVLVRFNRSKTGEVVSMYTDAKITHGNSGGPCFNLATGGVFAINTFGAWHSIEQAHEMFRKMQLGDLVGYYGVIPIRYLLEDFPEYVIFPRGYNQGWSQEDYLILARDLLYGRKPLPAERILKKLVEEYPELGEAHFLLGYAYLLQGKLEDTLKEWQKALKLHPRHKETLLALGNVYKAMGDYVKAASYVSQALEVDPKDPDAHLLQGQIYFAVKRYEDALQEARKAKKLTHQLLAEPVVLEGKILYAMGRLEEGKKRFEEAMKINPHYLPAWLGLGRYYELKDMYEAAVMEYDKAKNRFPRAQEPLVAIGRCYQKTNQYRQALAFYQKAIGLCEKNNLTPSEELLYQTSWILTKHLKEPKSALRLLAKYFLFHGAKQQAFRAHLLAAESAKEMGDLPLSYAHFSKASSLRPKAKELKELKESIPKAPIVEATLIRMARLGYDPITMISLLQVAPLGFRITTKKQVVRLAKQGVPVGVILFLLELQKRRKVVGEPTQPNPATPAPPTQPTSSQTLVGQWQGMTQTPQGVYAGVVLVFAPNGVFSMTFFDPTTSRAFYVARGVYSAQGNVLTLTIQSPTYQVIRAFYQIQGNQLILRTAQGQDVLYRVR